MTSSITRLKITDAEGFIALYKTYLDMRSKADGSRNTTLTNESQKRLSFSVKPSEKPSEIGQILDKLNDELATQYTKKFEQKKTEIEAKGKKIQEYIESRNRMIMAVDLHTDNLVALSNRTLLTLDILEYFYQQ